MGIKLVIVGGVAGGATAAARARRLSEDAEVVVFEKDRFISFANCGLPYHIGGDIPDRESLLLQTPESMYDRFSLDIRVQTEVVSIDRKAKTVRTRDVVTGTESDETYDYLLLSPGANPVVPPIPGSDHPKVFTLRNIPDMDAIIKTIETDSPQTAVVIGGGFIGIEMAEALTRVGIATTLVELADQVMASVDPEMAVPLHREIRRHHVRLRLKTSVDEIKAEGDHLTLTLSDASTLTADMVVMAIGVRPETSLARESGLKIGKLGGIAVDDHLRTSDPNIYAVGDAIEVRSIVGGQQTLLPLASPANRQARIAADNIFGRDTVYPGVVGTSICKVFDKVVGSVGLNEKTLKRSTIPYTKIYVHPSHHANYYPGAQPVSFKLLFDPKDGTIFGAQAVGQEGIDKRIDIVATLIKAGKTVYDMEEAELSYAPPYGSARDVINQAGMVASNVLRGDHPICYAEDVLKDKDAQFILDVRNQNEVGELGQVEGAVTIPLPDLRDRLVELPKDRPIAVYCAVGLRGYLAALILKHHGFDVRNITGGHRTLDMAENVGH